MSKKASHNHKLENIKTSWALICIAVVAVAAAGAIYVYADNNQTLDDVYSTNFISPMHSGQIPKKPLKAGTQKFQPAKRSLTIVK